MQKKQLKGNGFQKMNELFYLFLVTTLRNVLIILAKGNAEPNPPDKMSFPYICDVFALAYTSNPEDL